MNNITKYRKGHLFLLTVTLLAAFGFSGCKKPAQQIPYVPVHAVINTTLPAYIDLNVTGGWVYVTGGSRGILIYRSSQDDFKAYDRHATYEIEEYCTVEVGPSQLIVHDPCSGSEWSITDGSVIEGPAALPLHPYQTTFDGTTLQVFN